MNLETDKQVPVTAKYFCCLPTNTASLLSLLQRCGNQFTHQRLTHTVKTSEHLTANQLLSSRYKLLLAITSLASESLGSPCLLSSDWEAAKTHSISNRLGAL